MIRRCRSKWRRRQAYRACLFPPPLRSLPAITRQFYEQFMFRRHGGQDSHPRWCPWPRWFREE